MYIFTITLFVLFLLNHSVADMPGLLTNQASEWGDVILLIVLIYYLTLGLELGGFTLLVDLGYDVAEYGLEHFLWLVYFLLRLLHSYSPEREGENSASALEGHCLVLSKLIAVLHEHDGAELGGVVL